MLMDQGQSRKHLGDAFKPDPNSSSFRRPVAEMNIASGCPLFVSQSVLETGSYIKDDTIFIKVRAPAVAAVTDQSTCGVLRHLIIICVDLYLSLGYRGYL